MKENNKYWGILFKFLGIFVLLFTLLISQIPSKASDAIAAYTCDDAVDQIPPLPNFKLPYPSSENSNIKLSGGPHMFGDQNTSNMFPYGCGTGLDFAKNGQTFRVTAMAAGEVIAYGCDLIPGFGCIAVVKHDGGEFVMVYAHMDKNSLMPFFPLHISQGYTLGYAGNSGPTDDVHLHIELRASYDPATRKLGKKIGWERIFYNSGTIDGYRIYGYADGNYGSSSLFYNYDGVAVKGTEHVIYNFKFKEYLGTNRTGVTTVVGDKYYTDYWLAGKCTGDSCENNTIDTNSDSNTQSATQFSGGGVMGGGGYLYSSNQPVDNGSDDQIAPSGNFTVPSNGSTINTRTATISANASDNSGGSGVREVRFKARWSGGDWNEIGADSGSPYSIQWDMCNFKVPQGILELDLDVYDNAGNKYTYSSNHPSLNITKNYDCSGSGLPSADQWHAEAWMNKYLAGLVNKSEYWPAGVTNVTYPFIGFEKNWGDGAPYAGFPSDEFSFKIYSNLYFRGGQYHFRVCSDDGVVLEIDGQKVIDEWWDRGGCLQTDRSLDNKYHTIEARYYENRGNAYIRLYIWGEEFPQPELDEPDGRITSPTNNTYVSQNPLTIWADAWDDKSGIDYVKFKVYHCLGGCQWRDLGIDNTAPYRFENWDWSPLEGQQVKLAIDVTDKSGRTRGNAGGEITVNLDKTPPNISFTSPTNGTFDPDKQVAINVSASDTISGVASVKFFAGYENGANNYWHEIGTDTNGSDGWGMNWNASSLSDGKVVDIYATAYDIANNMGSAVVYGITLGNNPRKKLYLPAIQNGLPVNYKPTWSLVTSSNQLTLWDVKMLSESDGWIVGGWCCNPWISTIKHYNGAAWSDVTHPGQYQLFTLEMINQNEGWAGGQFGELLHYSNGTWERASGVTSKDIRDISMLSTTDGWAVANSDYPDYTSEILRYQNGNWTVYTSGLSKLTEIDMVSSNDGWIVGGDGKILHFNGSSWVSASSPTTGWIYEVQMLNSTTGWAIVMDYEILKYSNGSWSRISAPYGRPWAMDFISETEGWLAGDDLYHFKDGHWINEYTLYTNQPSLHIFGLDMISSTRGWAVGGFDGVILEYK